MRKIYLLFTLLCVFSLHTAFAQTRQITGEVKSSEDGSAVVGATVVVKGNASVATITDLDGRFTLNVPENAEALVFSFLGMETQEVAIGESSVVNVVLVPSETSLDEIVVVGYGTQIKSKVTGNISKVSGEEIKNTPVPSVQQALQGKSAGVFIESTTGKSSGITRMRIRGSSSISATNEPLFIVDGVALSTEALNQSGAAINPLTSINVNDIESIDILKDASSTAIYGSRGANGVVLITTKKGKAGDTKLNVNFQYGFSKPSNMREFMNKEQFLSYFREAAYNSDLIEGYDPINNPDDYQYSWLEFTERRFIRYSGHAAILDPNEPIQGKNYLGSEVDTDWQKEIFQNGGIRMVDLSASGGTDKLKYFASGSYSDQQSIIISNGLKRYSGRLNVDNKVNNFIDMGFTLSLTRTDIDQVSADNAFSTPMQMVALAPITPVRDLDGILYGTPTTTYYNPLIDVEYANRDILETRTVANSYIKFAIYKGLNWRNEFGFDLYNLKENARYGERTDSGTGVGGYAFSNYGQNQNLVLKSYFDYLQNVGDFGISAILGTEFQKTRIDNSWLEGQNFPTDELKTLASAGEITDGSQSITEYSFLSYFSRLNFDYQSKYLFTLAGRIDGSSRFGENKRFGFFPAASAGWVVSKESFLSDNPILSFLKIRTSYGLTGNAGIGNFQHLGLYGVDPYNAQPGFIPSQIPNPDLGWESTRQVDFGIDFGFIKNRITGEIDYYVKKTKDLLLNVPVPGTSGFSVQTQNLGSVENKGIEFVLNTKNITGQFNWSTSLNFSYNKNEVTDLGEQEIIDAGSSRFMNVVMLGQPLGVFYGAEYAGVASDDIPGGNPDGSDIYGGDAIWYVNEKDENGNIINPEAITNDFGQLNFVVLGHPTPDYMGAITNTFDYKGLELSFTFQGVWGNKIHLAGDTYMAANGAWFDNQTTDQLRSWKQPGDITDIPQARLGYSNGDQARNSRYLSDGSYIKLRSLTLGYTFPQNIISKVKFSNLRIYIQAQNLLTFTKYIGWDPEVSTDFAVTNVVSGVDFYSAPQPRSITFGINIGL
jgi:TonB-dependent starch-binding outer membrane protein SusC